MMNQTRLKMVCALMCVLWLALGGTLPAQAATPSGGALAQATAQGVTQAALPVRLVIPSLEIDAPIEAVGQDDNAVMAAPSSVATVAWYNLGPRPGENGNAVIAGHYDDVKGKPAVFWELDELKAGDEIIVRFRDASEQRFEVMTVETYDTDEAPLERIFGVDFERDLNLITCDGQWNAQSKLYERRLVVYTRLIRDGTAEIVPAIRVKPAAAGREETVAVSVAQVANGESVDDATQTNTPSTIPIPPSPRTTHARQDGGQPLATR